VCLCLSNVRIVTKQKHPAKKSLVMTNRKLTTSFPMSIRWTSYVASESPKGASEMQIDHFSSISVLLLKKVCCKVSWSMPTQPCISLPVAVCAFTLLTRILRNLLMSGKTNLTSLLVNDPTSRRRCWNHEKTAGDSSAMRVCSCFSLHQVSRLHSDAATAPR